MDSDLPLIYNDAMAEIPASFIPQKEIRSRKKKNIFQVNIFLLLSIIVFLTTIGASFGVFLWKNLAETSRDANLEQLNNSDRDLNRPQIIDFINTSNRLQSVEQILSQHVDVTTIFDTLEQFTLTEVVLSNFRFNTVDGEVRVSADGTAPTYDYVAVQAKTYDQPILKDLILSNVDQNREGSVSFTLEFSILQTDLYIN